MSASASDESAPALPATPAVVTPQHHRTLLEGPLGAIEVLGSAGTGGALSVVLHPLAPRALGSPIHTHRDEDEYSYVLNGTVGVQVGETVALAGPGDLVCKPRGVPHAFWNPTDEPATLLELITPGGFTAYFAELGEILASSGPDPDALGRLAERFHLTLDPSSIGRLAQEHGLRLGP